jgi:hypothetical protein
LGRDQTTHSGNRADDLQYYHVHHAPLSEKEVAESMSIFMVNLTAINPFDKQRSTPPIGVMVDTGAEDSDLANKLAPLLGVHTIEGFNVMIDNVAQRFVATIPTV